MRVLKETLFTTTQILGFLSAFIVWYMMFWMVGDLLGSQLYGTFLYILSTVLVMSFFAAREKIAHEDKMQEMDEKNSI